MRKTTCARNESICSLEPRQALKCHTEQMYGLVLKMTINNKPVTTCIGFSGNHDSSEKRQRAIVIQMTAISNVDLFVHIIVRAHVQHNASVWCNVTTLFETMIAISGTIQLKPPRRLSYTSCKTVSWQWPLMLDHSSRSKCLNLCLKIKYLLL